MIAISTPPPTPPASTCWDDGTDIETTSRGGIAAYHSTEDLSPNTSANDACDTVPNRPEIELLCECANNIAAGSSRYQLDDDADYSS
jgi:hypothetical protein